MKATTSEIRAAATEGLLSLPELLGFSAEDGERLYRAARGLEARGARRAAAELVRFLVRARPFVAEYWRAHGEYLAQAEHYPSAIRAFTVALAMEPDDRRTAGRRGECCLLVGLAERGLDDLRHAAGDGGVIGERARSLLLLAEGSAQEVAS